MRSGCAVVAVLLSTVVAFASQSSRPSTQSSRTIVPGVRFGPIEESTSRVRLNILFGAKSVRDIDVGIGEGICTPGTEVLTGTTDALDVAWQDAARTRVAFVRTRSRGARWVTTRGVRIGTTLRELERLAGRVVTFSGFEWDYAGGLDWQEGGRSLGLRLDVDARDAAKLQAAHDRSLFGDRVVASDHPVIRQLRIAVYEITLAWGRQFEERDCG